MLTVCLFVFWFELWLFTLCMQTACIFVFWQGADSPISRQNSWHLEGFLIDKSDFNEFNQNTRTFLNGFPCVFQINYCPWATNSINSFALPSILAGFVDLSATNYHTLAHFYRINISFHLYVSVCMSIWITLLNVKKVFVPVQSTYFWRACQKMIFSESLLNVHRKVSVHFFPNNLIEFYIATQYFRCIRESKRNEQLQNCI